MKNKISLLFKRIVVYTALSCMVSQTAQAGLTDISNVPLATAGGSTVLPNLLFTLDDSLSMTWDFMPDYVNPNQSFVSLTQSNPCMTDSGGRTYCVRGDPPYEAGGSAGFNGVGYDPNFYYHQGVNSNGQPVLNPLLSVASPATVARADAYNSASGAVNLTSTIADMQYCNSRGVCKGNGANTSGTVVAGTAFLDSNSSSIGTAMGPGEFPYRTNPANASTAVFGLPEMMSIASFTRSSTTVTATTLTPHGLTTTDKIYVASSANSALNVTCVAINTTTATTFQYTTSSSGTITATGGTYRRCTDGSFTRASSTVTVTKAGHGLVNNDVITTFVGSGNAMNATNVFVSNVDSNSFQYTTGTSGSLSATGGFWVRTGLYNVGSSSNGPPVSYSIIPVEYCSDRALTNCSAVKAIPNPTGTFTQSGTTVTVTSASHGLATGDKVNASSTTRSANASNAAITVIDANTFRYTSPISATVGAATAITISSAPATGFTFPAYVRFCQTQEQAVSPGVISDSSGTPRCRRVYNEDATFTRYLYPRYGFFRRDTITSTVGTYTNRPGRTDCVAMPTCTYAEEIANYARWYTYYRTRMQMMKSALGESLLAFIGSPAGSPPKPNALRLGLITINPYYTNPSPPTTGPGVGNGASNPGDPSARYLRIADFNTTQASNFYSKLYSIYPPLAGTPLQSALARAGWIYAGKMNTGLTSGIPAADDPVQSACQRNYTLLTTDGYWNYLSSFPPYQLDGTTVVGNLDNTPQTMSGSTLVDRSSTNTLDGLNGITDTVTTNSTSSEQVICQGNLGVDPSIDPAPGSGRNCGCGVKEHALYQENVGDVTTTHQVNGVTTSTTPGTTINFTNLSGCVPANWQDVAQPRLQYEVKQCDRASGSGTVSFTNGGSASCTNCSTSSSGKRYILIRQKRVWTQTSTYVDSNPTATQVSNGTVTATYEYCAAGAGCSASGSTGWSSTPPASSSACTTTSVSSNPPIGLQAAVNNGSSSATTGTGTALTIALSPNPQTTIGGPVTTTFSGAGTSSTLADVALYFFKTNLRAGGTASGPKFSPATTPASTVDLSGNQMILKSGGKDFMPYQHMVTFGIGLADGFMNYQADYETATSGDFFNIKSGANNACFWSSPGTCNWAQPKDGAPAPGPSGANLDDLWHAAVNGRGNFYQATNPEALRTGIGSALSALNSQIAAAAASATSSPNVTQTDNQIFSTTYETNTWSGRVYAQLLDPVNASVLPTHLWDGDTLLVQKVSAGSDSRNIMTFDSSATNKLKAFTYATLSGTEQVYFSNRCAPPAPASALSQCSLLTPAQVTLANDGTRFVGYLRGWQQDESVLFRDRQLIDPITGAVTNTVLGDTISARPMYVRNPTLSYTDPVTPTYSQYASTNSGRASRVYVAANDGFLHAFDGNTGDESWAYLPRFLMPSMYYLADNTYGLQHRFYLDGSPEAFDVYDTTANAWKTVLIGGAGGGAAGFYALDVTDPVNPKGLWEFCNDSTLCSISDANIGLSYGNPIVGKRSSDGRWVVVLSSGLNNTSVVGATGHGIFYVLDVITGAILNRVDTGVGTLTTPAGLMKMSAFYDSAATDATFRYLYGGDQLGNIWRLDMGDLKGACDAPAATGATAPCVTHFATLKDGSGFPQPITTRAALTHIGTNRVLYIGTGRYLGTQDLSDTHLATGSAYQQTLYGIKDKNVDYGANVRTGAQLVTQTLTQISSTERGITNNPVDWNTKDGWMVDFNPVADPTPGERVNIDPRLVLGTLRVITNIPAGGGACAVGGTSKVYDFDFRTGSTVAGTGSVVGTSSDTLIVGQAIVQTQTGDIYGLNKREDTGDDPSKVKQKPGGSGMQRFSYRER